MAKTSARKKIAFAKTSFRFGVIIFLGLAAFAGTVASAADDTARFYGTWQAHIQTNGQIVTVISVHDANGYKNYMRQPSGDTPAGEGAFSAANGTYKTSAESPNNGGLYYFMGNDTAVCTNLAGQIITWRRLKASAEPHPVDANTAARNTTGYTPPSDRPGNQTVNPGASQSPNAQPAGGPASKDAFSPDPSLAPEVNAALAAMRQKDYNTAWRDFMSASQKGDSDGEFGLGAMLYRHVNPPGTDFYAQCEKWLLASANHGNAKGMEFLARYYYDVGVATAGGINPGVNNAPIPPALQAQAEGKFKMSRQWFERASDKGDVYAMGNLALMLDAGVGGPRDPDRAAQLRARVKAGPDAEFARRATADPGNLAITAAWQSGHYADAIKNAQSAAAKGDANSEALLGRAYYEGVGVPRNYSTALFWLNKAVGQGNADGMFFLGLMYEHAHGVNQDIPKAMDLFDRAGEKGQRFAQMEAKGMRMQGEANRQAALARSHGGVEDAACAAAGGISSPGECLKGGGSIDPFNAEQAAGSGY
jgi:TPR repeat protein